MLARQGKIMVGWEEIAAGPMPKDVVVQAWRTSNAISAATAQGRPTIVSAGYYLDLLMPAAFHYGVDPFDPVADGFTPAEAAAAQKANPLAGAAVAPLVLKPLPPLTSEQQKLVLGAEGALWSELVSDETLDARLWPRMAALAERFWSPAAVRDPDDMYRRLAVVEDELRILGLQDTANQVRMAARLAPGDWRPVMTFLGLVGPVRNAAHNHVILAILHGQRHPPPQALTSLADAAPVDSLVARRFEDQARRLAEGDRSLAPELSRQLEAWRDNDALFAAAARGRPGLEAALPVSADIAVLAQAGLDAVDALQAGRPMTAEALARAEAALDKAAKAEAASARPIFAFMRPQPPADLIIAITPGIRRLVVGASAAGSKGPLAPIPSL
jgi:hexosaminidase